MNLAFLSDIKRQYGPAFEKFKKQSSVLSLKVYYYKLIILTDLVYVSQQSYFL